MKFASRWAAASMLAPLLALSPACAFSSQSPAPLGADLVDASARGPVWLACYADEGGFVIPATEQEVAEASDAYQFAASGLRYVHRELRDDGGEEAFSAWAEIPPVSCGGYVVEIGAGSGNVRATGPLSAAYYLIVGATKEGMRVLSPTALRSCDLRLFEQGFALRDGSPGCEAFADRIVATAAGVEPQQASGTSLVKEEIK